MQPWKLLAEWEIRRFTSSLPTLVERRTCQSLGILSIGLDELRAATALRGKADMRRMADLARAEHFLMLRFWLYGATPCFAGAELCLSPILFCGRSRLGFG